MLKGMELMDVILDRIRKLEETDVFFLGLKTPKKLLSRLNYI